MSHTVQINHVMTRKHYEAMLAKIVAEKAAVATHMTQTQREIMQAQHRAQFDEECA